MADESDVVDLFDKPIAFHPSLAKLAGSVNAGLMLSQALYWSKRTRNLDGWFYKDQKEWEQETCLGRREQETARKLLRSCGFWEEKRQDSPARLYYRINRQALNVALLRMAESANLECRKPPIKTGANGHTPRAGSDLISENTTEIGVRPLGYKQPVRAVEEKFLYPPPDFRVSEGLYVWLAECCFSFSDSEIREATDTWRESRESKPQHFKRTLGQWEGDWKKFMRIYWKLHKPEHQNGHGRPPAVKITTPEDIDRMMRPT